MALKRFNRRATQNIMSRVKRLFEAGFALVIIVVLTPVFLLIAVYIKMDSTGPVFFKQARGGLKGRHFTIYKFRTMYQDIEKEQEDRLPLPDDDRITKSGALLRRTSLDELPQLINILKGEMSFIGPRPTLASQTDQYNEYQMKRLEVKPGVTGLAQITGRNELSWTEKIELDIEYIQKKSLKLDLSILLQTFHKVLHSEGIYQKSIK